MLGGEEMSSLPSSVAEETSPEQQLISRSSINKRLWDPSRGRSSRTALSRKGDEDWNRRFATSSVGSLAIRLLAHRVGSHRASPGRRWERKYHLHWASPGQRWGPDQRRQQGTGQLSSGYQSVISPRGLGVPSEQLSESQ